MMFHMNGVEYKIIEVPQSEYNKVNEDDGYYYGQSHFYTQEIYISEDVSYERKKKTLYHELMHCYIREYITTKDIDSFDEEILCDISANAHDIIHEIVEQYMCRGEI